MRTTAYKENSRYAARSRRTHKRKKFPLVSIVCIDPPYLVSLESKSGKITNDDLDYDNGYRFILEALKRVNENMADDASIYMFYADSKTQIFANAFDEAGFHRSATVIWKKDQLVLTRTDFKYIHEPIT